VAQGPAPAKKLNVPEVIKQAFRADPSRLVALLTAEVEEMKSDREAAARADVADMGISNRGSLNGESGAVLANQLRALLSALEGASPAPDHAPVHEGGDSTIEEPSQTPVPITPRSSAWKAAGDKIKKAADAFASQVMPERLRQEAWAAELEAAPKTKSVPTRTIDTQSEIGQGTARRAAVFAKPRAGFVEQRHVAYVAGHPVTYKIFVHEDAAKKLTSAELRTAKDDLVRDMHAMDREVEKTANAHYSDELVRINFGKYGTHMLRGARKLPRPEPNSEPPAPPRGQLTDVPPTQVAEGVKDDAVAKIQKNEQESVARQEASFTQRIAKLSGDRRTILPEDRTTLLQKMFNATVVQVTKQDKLDCRKIERSEADLLCLADDDQFDGEPIPVPYIALAALRGYKVRVMGIYNVHYDERDADSWTVHGQDQRPHTQQLGHVAAPSRLLRATYFVGAIRDCCAHHEEAVTHRRGIFKAGTSTHDHRVRLLHERPVVFSVTAVAEGVIPKLVVGARADKVMFDRIANALGTLTHINMSSDEAQRGPGMTMKDTLSVCYLMAMHHDFASQHFPQPRGASLQPMSGSARFMAV